MTKSKFAGLVFIVLLVSAAEFISRKSPAPTSQVPVKVTIKTAAVDLDQVDRLHLVIQQNKRAVSSAQRLPSGQGYAWSKIRGELNFKGLDAVLSEDEIRKLCDTFCEYQMIKAQFESKLVRNGVPDNGATTLIIDPYPRAGFELKQMFMKSLSGPLPPAKFLAVQDSMQEILDEYFAFFGTVEQKYVVRAENNQNRPPQYTITYQRHSVEGVKVDEVRDPSQGGFGASSSTVSLSIREIQDGEFGAIVPKITKSSSGY